MSRSIYINGSYKPYDDAVLHVEDRATLFADSIYEVIEVRSGELVDEKGHIERLKRSLNEIRLEPDFSIRSIPFIMRETIKRNKVRDGFVYIQISRGVARRDFIFPAPFTTPATLIIFARRKNHNQMEEKAKQGIKVITRPDIRWKRPDIKSTGLLASVLARQDAIELAAEEAWLLDEDDFITEGAASNAWIINANSELITRPTDGSILKGITREGVMRVAREVKLEYVERKFSRQEAYEAKEAFITAATNLVMPVTHIDDETINNGKPGPISLKLRLLFHEFAQLSV